MGRNKMLKNEIGYLAMEATVLIEAFEHAVNLLGIDPNHGAARLVVAKHIITFAKAGECDPVRLCDLAVKAMRQGQHRPATGPARLILIQS